MFGETTEQGLPMTPYFARGLVYSAKASTRLIRRFAQGVRSSDRFMKDRNRLQTRNPLTDGRAGKTKKSRAMPGFLFRTESPA